MRSTLLVCLIAICLVRAEAVPVTGIWEAQKDGRKAITLDIREREGILGGSVVLYIIHDDHDGSLDGTPLDPEAMVGTTWDGKVLRFRAGVATFELRVTGANKGELKVIAPEHSEITEVTRRRER
jgi:hypothetical protein